MDKVTKITVAQIVTNHNFYCDSCDEYIGASTEGDDGYYEELGECTHSFRFNGKGYKINYTLCPICKEKLITKIQNTLIQLGFSVEG